MDRTSKSPRKVTMEAYEVAKATLPAYSHRFSPKKFTQHQLFALLVLKTHQRQDYRGVIALLRDMPELAAALGLSSLPHYTTLQKAAERMLLDGPLQQLLSETVERHRRREAPDAKKATARSSWRRPTRAGLDASRASRYFVRRRANNAEKTEQLVAYRSFPKLELVCDCSSHLIIAAYATVGPTPDLTALRRLLFSTLGRVSVNTLLADAGYDSEDNHRFARDGCGVRSVIPPLHGRPTTKPPSTPHRRRMSRYRDHRYGQRWQAETVMSMIKRNLGPSVAARSDAGRAVETMLKALTHNLMLLAALITWLFYRAGHHSFFPHRRSGIG